jgi:hypothetical protein
VDLEHELELDMQVAVKDAIFEGATNDYVLASLIELTMQEATTGRYLFQNPLDEPILYSRYFKTWVNSAIESLKKIQKGNS